MEQSPSWEANRFSASQEIPSISWKPEVHYCIHITTSTSTYHLPLACARSIQFVPPHPVSWETIFILSSHLWLGHLHDLFLSGLPDKTRYAPFLSAVQTTWPSHLILLDLITPKIFGEEYVSWSSSLCSHLHFSVTSSVLGPAPYLKLPQCEKPSFTSIQNNREGAASIWKSANRIFFLFSDCLCIILWDLECCDVCECFFLGVCSSLRG